MLVKLNHFNRISETFNSHYKNYDDENYDENYDVSTSFTGLLQVVIKKPECQSGVDWGNAEIVTRERGG